MRLGLRSRMSTRHVTTAVVLGLIDTPAGGIELE
jgi:hypothetical protein